MVTTLLLWTIHDTCGAQMPWRVARHTDGLMLEYCQIIIPKDVAGERAVVSRSRRLHKSSGQNRRDYLAFSKKTISL